MTCLTKFAYLYKYTVNSLLLHLNKSMNKYLILISNIIKINRYILPNKISLSSSIIIMFSNAKGSWDQKVWEQPCSGIPHPEHEAEPTSHCRSWTPTFPAVSLEGCSWSQIGHREDSSSGSGRSKVILIKGQQRPWGCYGDQDWGCGKIQLCPDCHLASLLWATIPACVSRLPGNAVWAWATCSYSLCLSGHN